MTEMVTIPRSLLNKLVREARDARFAGDNYPEGGWPRANAAVAEYNAWKRTQKMTAADRAKLIVDGWPSWKRHYKLTKY